MRIRIKFLCQMWFVSDDFWVCFQIFKCGLCFVCANSRLCQMWFVSIAACVKFCFFQVLVKNDNQKYEFKM